HFCVSKFVTSSCFDVDAGTGFTHPADPSGGFTSPFVARDQVSALAAVLGGTVFVDEAGVYQFRRFSLSAVSVDTWTTTDGTISECEGMESWVDLVNQVQWDYASGIKGTDLPFTSNANNKIYGSPLLRLNDAAS